LESRIAEKVIWFFYFYYSA